MANTKTYHVKVRVNGEWQNLGYYYATSESSAMVAASFDTKIAITGNEWDIKEV